MILSSSGYAPSLKLFLFVLLSLAVPFTALAEEPTAPADSIKGSKKKNSFTNWDIEGIAEHVAFCALPAQDIYNSWITDDIHPYKFDPLEVKDTVRIPLIDSLACGFVHPVDGKVTSAFGPRRYRYHYGIDIDLNTGDPVYAAFDGTVRIAQYSTTYGYTVVIRHHNGLETLYAHLSKMMVTPGDKIEAGDRIGLGGRTGRSTGPHLHFEVRYKGWSLNPSEFICFDTGTLSTEEYLLTPAALDHLTWRQSGTQYTVRAGDSLYRIANSHGISLQQLCTMNKITANTVIRPGQQLRVR
jgi:murein DD-endopeptidase MepM/ murein hydrolase activator NlpD